MYKKRWAKIGASLLLVVSVMAIATSILGMTLYRSLELDRFSRQEVVDVLNRVELEDRNNRLMDQYLPVKGDVLEINNRDFDLKTSNYVYQVFKGDQLIGSNKDEHSGLVVESDYSYMISGKYRVVSSVNPELNVWDNFRLNNFLVTIADEMSEGLIPSLMSGIVLGLASLFFILKSLGQRENYDGVYLGLVSRIPLELFLLGSLFITSLFLSIVSGYYYTAGVVFVSSIILVVFIISFVMGIILRIKSKTLLKNSFTYRILVYFKGVYKKLPLIRKGMAVYGIISIVEFFVFAATGTFMLFFYWIVRTMLLGAILVRILLDMKSLESAGELVAMGNIDLKIDTESLLPIFRNHGESLNRISSSVEVAVEEQMKSERMKTELITNVSHDIKTPLTSIINYVDLLKKEDIDNEVAVSYLEPLDRQSQKMAKLVDDLMVASRVTSGNVDIHKEAVQLNVVIEQAAGEFMDRMSENNIDLVVSGVSDEVVIDADPRMMSRIVDNLITNVMKYSLPGTRAFMGIEPNGEFANLVIKNTSKEPITVDEKDLLERFVRGDSSRNTEGSGLGLSIAKNMVELQGGAFELVVDGDLFKVICSFIRVEDTE